MGDLVRTVARDCVVFVVVGLVEVLVGPLMTETFGEIVGERRKGVLVRGGALVMGATVRARLLGD